MAILQSQWLRLDSKVAPVSIEQLVGLQTISGICLSIVYETCADLNSELVAIGDSMKIFSPWFATTMTFIVGAIQFAIQGNLRFVPMMIISILNYMMASLAALAYWIKPTPATSENDVERAEEPPVCVDAQQEST